MVTRQRTDLHMNIPALRKLDAMLVVSIVISHLDCGFLHTIDCCSMDITKEKCPLTMSFFFFPLIYIGVSRKF